MPLKQTFIQTLWYMQHLIVLFAYPYGQPKDIKSIDLPVEQPLFPNIS